MMAPTLDAPSYFDQLAQVEAVHWWHAAMWRIASGWLDRALRGRSDLVALDVGCGSGGTLRRLADRPEIGRVLGLERSRLAIAMASCPQRRDKTGPTLVRGSALALPFPTSSIDLVACFDVLQHLPTGGDRVAIEEMRRVLRPGGIGIIRSNGAGLWPDPSRVDQPYQLAAVANLARSAGMIVRKATYANCLPAVATEILGRIRRGSEHGHPQGGGLRIRARPTWTNRAMSAVATLESLAVTHLNMRFPVGHSTMMLVVAPGRAAA